MKMSNFENPTWRTAAILKIIISPYLSRKSRRISRNLVCRHKFYPRRRKRDKKFRNSQIQNGGWTPYWKSLFGYNSAVRCPIKMNFGVRRQNHTYMKQARGDQNAQLRKSQTADVNILKMDIPPYLSRESSKFDEILHINANFETAEETWQT